MCVPNRTRRALLVAAVLLAALLVLGLVAVLLPPVQRAAWERVTGLVASRTGWRVEAERVRLRPWPARLRLEGLAAGGAETTVVTVEELEASWSWLDLLGGTPRLEELRLEGLRVDLREGLPAAPPEAEPRPPAAEPLKAFEIERLMLAGGEAHAAGAGIGFAVEGIRAGGRLVEGRGGLAVTADEVSAVREGRTLRLSSLAVELEAAGDRATLSSLKTGGAVEAELSGELSWEGDVPAASVRGTLAAEPGSILSWWDPELASRVPVVGRLELEGRAGRSEAGQLEVALEHVGSPLEVAGFEVVELELSSDGGAPAGRLAGGWGWARASLHDDRVEIAADLSSVQLDRALAAGGTARPAALPADLSLSGRVDAVVPLPFDPAEASGRASLEGRWSRGGLELEARAEGGAVVVERATARVASATVSASGRLGPDRGLTGSARIEVEDPRELLAAIGPWLPVADVPEVAGGRIAADAGLDGSLSEPEISFTGSWSRPRVAGLDLESAELSGSGTPEALEWAAKLELHEGASVRAEGTARPRDGSVGGSWQVATGSLGATAERLAVEAPEDLDGRVAGEGGFEVGPGGWQVDGHVAASSLRVAGRRVEAAEVELAASSAGLATGTVRVAAAGGELTAEGSVGLEGVDGALDLRAAWRDLDPSLLVEGVPREAKGRIAGSVEVAGRIAAPTAVAKVSWRADDPGAPARSLELEGWLAGGTLRLATVGADTVAGPLSGRALVPLGDLPLPEWLWAGAPGGPVELHLTAVGVDTGAIVAALGRPPQVASARFDLRADARWDLTDPAERVAEAVIEGLELRSAVESLVADGPLVVTYAGGIAELEPVTLAGPRTRLELAGRVDIPEKDVRISAEARLSPQLTSLLPVPVRAEKTIDLLVELGGPWDAPVGSIHLRHPDGSLVLRDPPVVLGDLELVADVEDGVVDVRRGSASLNRGQVQLGGGWDPASGQGLVFELQDVVFLLPGQIISRWSGNIAVSPSDRGLAVVEGELVLDGGVWDVPVDLPGLLTGEAAAPPSPDDPLFGVMLDVDVRGRGRIRVDNNLGRFDVGWSVLSVTGSAAEPRIVGEVKIASGGVLTVGGQSVTLQRGTIELTGEPGAEPRIELVPEAGTTFDSSGAGVSWDDLARVGLARGVTSFLGIDNEALEPADIAVETEKPPATRFSIGKSLGRNLALFFTTDLREPQDTTTLLQLWNLRRVPGLALQAFTSSDEEWGWAAIERYSWGGAEGAGEGPVVRRLDFEGEWPLGKRRLRKAAGIDRGQPYDPFLLFVAELRLERALAEEGYYAPVVQGTATEGEPRVKLTFTSDPGPFQEFEFRGDEVRESWRREVLSLYLPPPLEETGFRAMAGDLRRRLAAAGHPDARVEVAREDDVVVVTVDRGPEIELRGPRVSGVAPGAAATVAAVLGGPAELASLEDDGEAATRRVERILDWEGFPDARVTEVRREPVGEGAAQIVIEVEAGDRIEVASLRVEGDDPLAAADSVRKRLGPGSPLVRRTVDDAVQGLRRVYREAGYVDVVVKAEIDRDAEEGPEVVLRLEPGEQRRLESVEIVGLDHLREGPVRHGVTVEEGEVLSPSEIDRTVANIASFRPVHRVEAQAVPVGSDRTKVTIEVYEKDRWTIGGGARWSSDRGTEGLVDLRDDNLLGRGLSLNLRGRYSPDEQEGLLLVSLPPLPGGRVTLSGSLRYNRLDDPDEFGNVLRKDTREGTVEATYELDPGSAVRGYYTFRRVRTFEVDPPIPEFAFDVTTDIATLGSQWYRDQLDDPFLPSRGTYLSADLGWSASALGSDVDTLRTFLTGTLAWTPARRVTLYQSLRIGVAEALSGELDPELKYRTGGQGTIRGFDFESIGPVEEIGGSVRVVGGGALLIVNEELRVRVWKELRVAAFVDAGNVWETYRDVSGDLAVGAGVGFRWATPIGPIWGDVAWPVANAGRNEGPKYYIGFGRPF